MTPECIPTQLEFHWPGCASLTQINQTEGPAYRLVTRDMSAPTPVEKLVWS